MLALRIKVFLGGDENLVAMCDKCDGGENAAVLDDSFEGTNYDRRRLVAT
jgi:hypothetical protein